MAGDWSELAAVNIYLPTWTRVLFVTKAWHISFSRRLHYHTGV